LGCAPLFPSAIYFDTGFNAAAFSARVGVRGIAGAGAGVAATGAGGGVMGLVTLPVFGAALLRVGVVVVAPGEAVRAAEGVVDGGLNEIGPPGAGAVWANTGTVTITGAVTSVARKGTNRPKRELMRHLHAKPRTSWPSSGHDFALATTHCPSCHNPRARAIRMHAHPNDRRKLLQMN